MHSANFLIAHLCNLQKCFLAYANICSERERERERCLPKTKENNIFSFYLGSMEVGRTFEVLGFICYVAMVVLVIIYLVWRQSIVLISASIIISFCASTCKHIFQVKVV